MVWCRVYTTFSILLFERIYASRLLHGGGDGMENGVETVFSRSKLWVCVSLHKSSSLVLCSERKGKLKEEKRKVVWLTPLYELMDGWGWKGWWHCVLYHVDISRRGEKGGREVCKEEVVMPCIYDYILLFWWCCDVIYMTCIFSN
jgi:hypothetical protein